MKTQTCRTAIALLLACPFVAAAHAAGADPSGNSDGAHACANTSLLGSFGFYRTGITGAGPLAAVGILHFDGYATVGTQTISRNGTFAYDLPIVGTYQIATDCTGKFFTPDGTEIARVVVVDHGDGFMILSESAGNAVYGVGRRVGGD